MSDRLPHYLLKATSDAEMRRWRQAAKLRGVTFADYVRGALETQTDQIEQGELPPWLQPNADVKKRL